MRNIGTFIEIYQEALYIAELNYGSLEIQRHKFLTKIDQATARYCKQRISDCMAPPYNQQLTMEELYQVAKTHSVNMNYGAQYGNEIYQLTTPETHFERKRFNHNIMINNNYPENYWERDTNPMINNISTDQRACYNCKKPGHLAKNCPDQIRTPQSKNMKRENTQARKGRERFRSQSRSRERYPYYRNKSRSRSRDQYYRNKSRSRSRERYGR